MLTTTANERRRAWLVQCIPIQRTPSPPVTLALRVTSLGVTGDRRFHADLKCHWKHRPISTDCFVRCLNSEFLAESIQWLRQKQALVRRSCGDPVQILPKRRLCFAVDLLGRQLPSLQVPQGPQTSAPEPTQIGRQFLFLVLWRLGSSKAWPRLLPWKVRATKGVCIKGPKPGSNQNEGSNVKSISRTFGWISP
eukprot:s344_g2.t1